MNARDEVDRRAEEFGRALSELAREHRVRLESPVLVEVQNHAGMRMPVQVHICGPNTYEVHV